MDLTGNLPMDLTGNGEEEICAVEEEWWESEG
jgi:hypothetical protein